VAVNQNQQVIEDTLYDQTRQAILNRTLVLEAADAVVSDNHVVNDYFVDAASCDVGFNRNRKSAGFPHGKLLLR
jgi:hypothetical protein